MKRFIIGALAALVIGGGFGAGLDGSRAGIIFKPTTSGGFVGSCSQSTTFIARTSGENNAALDTLICGFVTQGFIDSTATLTASGNAFCGTTGRFDRLWIMAMANAADALLDVCGHASLTANGAPTFTANAGYRGGSDGNSTVYLDTHFQPSVDGVRFTANSAHVMGWRLGAITNTSYAGMIGAGDTTVGPIATITSEAPPGGATTYCPINGNSLAEDAFSGVPGNSFVANRSGASLVQCYQGGTAASVANTTTPGITPVNFTLLSATYAGTHTGAAYLMPAASVGSTLSAAQVSSSGGNTGTGLVPLLCTYITAVHGSC